MIHLLNTNMYINYIELNMSVKVTQGSAEKYKTKLVCECHLIAVLKMVKVISLFIILDL